MQVRSFGVLAAFAFAALPAFAQTPGPDADSRLAGSSLEVSVKEVGLQPNTSLYYRIHSDIRLDFAVLDKKGHVISFASQVKHSDVPVRTTTDKDGTATVNYTITAPKPILDDAPAGSTAKIKEIAYSNVTVKNVASGVEISAPGQAFRP